MPPWDADDNDVNTSWIVILLKWLTTKDNTNMYLSAEDFVKKNEKFCGDNGITKNALTLEVSNIIYAKIGIRRSPKSLRCKIDQFFAKYKSANEADRSGRSFDWRRKF